MAALALSACAGSDEGGPPIEADAAEVGDARFACLGQPLPERAAETLTFPGSAMVAFAAGPHSDILVELVREADQTVVASDVTDSTNTDYGEANFEIEVGNRGLPFSGHFRLTKKGLPALLRYDARPFIAGQHVYLSIFRTENIDALAYHGGASPRDANLGMVEVWAKDCLGDPVWEAKISMTPAPRRLVYFPLSPEPATTEGPGTHAVGFDLPPGPVEVTVTVPGVGTYRPVIVQAIAGGVTHSFLMP